MRPGPLIARLGTALVVLAAAGALIAIAPHVALVLGPALLLFLTLAVGVFPGEDVLARARARRLHRPRVRKARSAARPALPDVVRPAGVARAFALAMRPPPVAAAGTR